MVFYLVYIYKSIEKILNIRSYLKKELTEDLYKLPKKYYFDNVLLNAGRSIDINFTPNRNERLKTYLKIFFGYFYGDFLTITI